jgi:predicted Zn-dependent peptidase
MTTTSAEKIQLHSIPGDPIRTQMYTLRNGMKLFMSVNPEEPRVYTEIAVRAGSKHDPADTTGLAHYFEHMMFKGTDRLGSLNWEKEKPLLDAVCALFEEHRGEKEPEKKKKLYAEIDRLSAEAAQYVAANEYDKLVSAIGAKDTNAYTWVEQTVYVNDIPGNELERWFQLESERFRRPILRLFHTELETVFEEYNINQDRDFRKVLRVMQEILTPTHPYGTQTTIGRGEDLKNPSQKNIYAFFDRYYVPNNMAVVLCGDFDPAKAVRLAEKYFGHYQPKELPPFSFPPQPEINQRTHRDVLGNEAPWVEMGWRFPGASSEATVLLPLVAGILHNHQAGLFDLNLIQKQQLLEAYAYPRVYEDFSSLLLHGKPREGQTHEQVEQLLLAEVEKLARGEFEDWLPNAVVKDMKLSEIKEFEKNQGRAAALTAAFVLGINWQQMVDRWNILEKVTKADIVRFAQTHLLPHNYGVVYKHTGPDPSVMKVEKPPITAIPLNRSDLSEFGKQFLHESTPDIQPQFLDFGNTLRKATVSDGVQLKAVQDTSSLLFRLFYTFDMGKNSDPKLSLAAAYLPYLGTGKLSAAEIQQGFYRLGLHFTANCQDEQMYLTLSGLPESFEAGIELMDHVLHNAQGDAEALQNLVADILKRRENDKRDKRKVLGKGMMNFAKYGRISPFTDKLSKQQLENLQPDEPARIIRELPGYRHEIFYYGPLSARKVAALLKKNTRTAPTPRPPLPLKKYRELPTNRSRVFFVDFPTVQVELLLLSKGTGKFNLEEAVFAEWYNQYFGYGLSSIVFQEIRESKALAYSAYAYAANPNRKKRAHYLQAYVGTQPDKLFEAVEAFQTILEDMPVSEIQIEHARQSVIKQIAASRISKSDIYWTWRQNRQRGIRNDMREDIYMTLKQADAEKLLHYHSKYIKGKHFTWMILGERDRIDFELLRKIGPVKELTLEDLFGY